MSFGSLEKDEKREAEIARSHVAIVRKVATVK